MNILRGENHHADNRAGEILRGVRRLLCQAGCVSVPEAPLKNGRRVDVLALDTRGEIVIVEIKSSRADFLADSKWREYLPWCDRFYFAIPPEMDACSMPEGEGLIVADAWGGDFAREAAKRRLAPARRRALTLALARLAARRLHKLQDPGAGGVLS